MLSQVLNLFVLQLVLYLVGMQILFDLSDALGIGKNTPTQYPGKHTKSLF